MKEPGQAFGEVPTDQGMKDQGKNTQIAADETSHLELGDVLTVIGEKAAIGHLRESLASL